MVARDAPLSTHTRTIACYVVIHTILITLVVCNDLWSVERVVQLKHQVGTPARMANFILGHKA